MSGSEARRTPFSFATNADTGIADLSGEDSNGSVGSEERPSGRRGTRYRNDMATAFYW